MKQIIIINYTQKALLDFIQIAYREKYEIIKTDIKEDKNLVHVHIKTTKNLTWYMKIPAEIGISICQTLYKSYFVKQ